MPQSQAIKAFSQAMEPFRVTAPLSGSDWADKYFYLSPESSGAEGRWRCYPYQVALLNWMTSDDIEQVNLQKSRRVGYTKCLMAAVACLIHQKNRNVAIWHPTDGDAKDFVTDEIDTMLRDVSVLGNKLKCKVGMKSKHNTIDKKSFHGATLDIKGGKSARNFRRMTKDVAVYDETDGFDIDIDGEGSCFELGDGRLDQAPFPKSIRGSTPKTKGASLIENAVENSDMVFFRFVRCPHCGVMQRLLFENLRWNHGDPETAHFVCSSGCRMDYRDYVSMDANGRWQTLDGHYYSEKLDRFFGPDDNPISKPRRLGVKIWAAYSYLRPWSYFVDRWLEACQNAKAGNITTLKAVINTLRGETFEERGESVSPTALSSRCEDYLSGGKIPVKILIITAGADVQGGAHARIEMEIVGHGIEGETWSLDYVVINGAIENPLVWGKLDEQLRRRFIREDGISMGIASAFIDSGYLANEVYKFTAPRRKRNIYATKGVTTGTLCNAGTMQGDKKRGGIRAILRTMNVDDAKTIVFNRLNLTRPGRGFCHFPAHYDDLHFQKLTNEEKVEKYNRGVLLGYEWVKKGPNEQLDCRVYALGALEFLNPNLERTKTRLEKQAEALLVGEKPVVLAENYTEHKVKKQQKRTKGRPKKGFINSWK